MRAQMKWMLLMVPLAAWASPTLADPATAAWSNSSLIQSEAMSDFRGVVGVNVAAGVDNAQINATSIALGAERGRGIAKNQIRQELNVEMPALPYEGDSKIEGSAFTHSHGVISVNQASGVGNAQANGVAISVGVGVESLSENELAQTVTVARQGNVATAATQGPRSAIVDERAFGGARGVVQLNQSAGVGNATANGFSLNISNPQ
ncbi:hypothetical protein [Acidihalobacter prosperus]|uniref:Adhesin n=1 Tax=Acidihalobacter prosperus TaxID=160660 RepID=A0A1A6C4V9_9GAMM|nr:hypothetical protein [Acidihalobacter prosperus]OBS09597.1 hypothetical protein Thpro_021925 [Acidihalobacter prosperus]